MDDEDDSPMINAEVGLISIKALCFTSTGWGCDNDEILKAFTTTFKGQL